MEVVKGAHILKRPIKKAPQSMRSGNASIYVFVPRGMRDRCYQNRTDDRTGKAENVTQTKTKKKLRKKPVNLKIHKIFIFCRKTHIFMCIHMNPNH